MDKLLKCCLCDDRASYAFLEDDIVKHICADCNEIMSTQVETFPLFQIVKGGKFEGRLKHFES